MPKTRNQRKSRIRYSQKSRTRKTINSKKPNSRSTCRDDIDCSVTHFRDKNYPNQIWNTCIEMDGKSNHILYVTPINVAIKSADTFQVPLYVVKMKHATMESSFSFTPVCNESLFRFSFRGTKRCNKKHYVSCFLRHCGTWYVVMIQSYSLVYNVHLFYKIKHAKNLLNAKGEMVFNPDMFVNVNAKSEEVTLHPKYLEEIAETAPILPLLKRFMNEKILANNIKQVATDVALFEAFDIAT